MAFAVGERAGAGVAFDLYQSAGKGIPGSGVADCAFETGHEQWMPAALASSGLELLEAAEVVTCKGSRLEKGGKGGKRDERKQGQQCLCRLVEAAKT